MTLNTDSGSLSRGQLFCYGALALPLSIASAPILIYLPAFYAKELGLDLGLVGLVFLLTRLWDGISDPLIGWLSDRTNLRIGRRKPWVIAGAPLLMVAIWFLCMPPDDVGLAYLALWAVLFYLAYTIVIVPYWSWGAELTSDYNQRNAVTGSREMFTMLGSLILGAAPVIFLPSDAPIADVLAMLTVILLVLIPLATILLLPVSDQQPQRRSRAGIFHAFREVVGCQLFIKFLAAFLLAYMALGIGNSVVVFFIGDALLLQQGLYIFIFIQYATAIVVAPFAVRLAAVVDKHIVIICGMMFIVIAFVLWGFIPSKSVYLAALGFGILGIGFSPFIVLPTSILADIIDYDTAQSGEDRAGLFVAVYNFTLKVGLAAGVGFSYLYLDIVGYDPSNNAQDEMDVLWLKFIFCGVTSLLFVMAMYCLRDFPVGRAMQKALREKIDNTRIATTRCS